MFRFLIVGIASTVGAAVGIVLGILGPFCYGQITGWEDGSAFAIAGWLLLYITVPVGAVVGGLTGGFLGALLTKRPDAETEE